MAGADSRTNAATGATAAARRTKLRSTLPFDPAPTVAVPRAGAKGPSGDAAVSERTSRAIGIRPVRPNGRCHGHACAAPRPGRHPVRRGDHRFGDAARNVTQDQVVRQESTSFYFLFN